jgi:replication factor A1
MESTIKKIDELVKEETNITIKAKILSISQKEANTQRGKTVYYYGLLGDTTGVMPFTAWSMPTTVRDKDVYQITKCYTKMFNERIRIYFDQGTEFKLLTEEMEVKRTYRYYSIRDLSINDKYVTVEGMLSNEKEREYEKDGQKRTIFQYILRDQTGTIPLSSFGKKLPVGKGIRIEGAKLDLFNGYYRLNTYDKTDIEEVGLKLTEDSEYSYIRDVKTPVGGIKISGFIISFGEKSGLITRCSECNTKLDDIRCADHPEKGVKYDVFTYFTMDDGTGYMQVNAGFDAISELTGITQEYLSDEKVPPLKKEIRNRLDKGLMHGALSIHGNARMTEQGMSFKAMKIVKMDQKNFRQIVSIQEEEFA